MNKYEIILKCVYLNTKRNKNLGKSKQKEGRDAEFFKGQIRELKSENRNLKKRIKKLERSEHNYNTPREKEEVIDDSMLNQCNECGKGFLKEIELVGRLFEVCSLCDHRKKLSYVKKRKKS